MHPIKLSVICVLACLLNFLTASVFFETLHIPLFLDTIFTVAVVFYSGLVPALCVSLSYNVINAAVWNYKGDVFDPFIFLYAICGVLIVVSTWLIARRKEEFRISMTVTFLYLVLISLFSSTCTVIAGGIIDYFHYVYRNVPDMMNPIKRFTDAFLWQRFSLLVSCIVAQIPVSFVDRLITTFAGYGVFRLGERFLGRW